MLIPVFFVLAMRSVDGRDTAANLVILIAGVSDYLDGLAARVTGQFSRLGALLDPLADRLLIIAAVIVIYKFELLSRYIVILVFAREILMLGLSAVALSRGVDIRINWVGRLAVWPLMIGGFIALTIDTPIAGVLMLMGIAGSYAASYGYVKSMRPDVVGASRISDSA